MSITILNDPQLSSDVYDLLMSRTSTLGSFCESSCTPNSRIMVSNPSTFNITSPDSCFERLHPYRNNG
ncbi:unnamed protein product [Caenorhabditis nigoni]